jgi:putative toxin-antitoxin system antitoxin component (TIGR02293 family)
MKRTTTKLRAKAHLGRGLSRSPSPTKNVPGLVHFFVGRATGTSAIPDLPLASQVKALEAGLPQSELTDLQASLSLTNDRLVSLVGLSKSTFHRYKGTSTNLDPLVSDRVVRFALLLSKAIKVFGGKEDAKKWLMSPQFGLGGEVPLDYAKTEVGAREVENLLGRVEYGVYA